MKPNRQAILIDLIPQWQREARDLLPELPENIEVEFNNDYLIPETGVGGFAAAKNKVILAYDPHHASSTEDQIHKLRASYLHECYHLAQGWVGNTNLLPLEEAILEGAATVFERDRADAQPPWGNYPARVVAEEWLSQVKKLGPDYDKTKWKYRDPQSNERWILYRLGAFIIDQALAKNQQLKIENLANVPAAEILQSAGY